MTQELLYQKLVNEEDQILSRFQPSIWEMNLIFLYIPWF